MESSFFFTIRQLWFLRFRYLRYFCHFSFFFFQNGFNRLVVRNRRLRRRRLSEEHKEWRDLIKLRRSISDYRLLCFSFISNFLFRNGSVYFYDSILKNLFMQRLTVTDPLRLGDFFRFLYRLLPGHRVENVKNLSSPRNFHLFFSFFGGSFPLFFYNFRGSDLYLSQLEVHSVFRSLEFFFLRMNLHQFFRHSLFRGRLHAPRLLTRGRLLYTRTTRNRRRRGVFVRLFFFFRRETALFS